MNITIEDLELYILPAVNGGLFQKKGQIKALKIIQLVDKSGKPIERHCLVIVDSENVKKRLIQSLNPKHIVNTGFIGASSDVKDCSVDEYFIRHWSNDRRSTRFNPSQLPDNKRIADRRRRGLSTVAQSEIKHSSAR
ncbi:MAG: hypothetical protein HOP23_14800 [Methylococcaceae bacterium]|nr:hypothetical protein [Methylococcaceae bacterium]